MQNPTLPDTTRNIQTYTLFGDHAALPDVVHVETIEARSTLHDWELTPHRHDNLHQVLLLLSGGGAVSLEGRTVALSDMRIVNVPIGIVHGYSFDPGTEGLVLTLAGEIVDQSLRPGEGLTGVLARAAVIPARADIVATLRQLADTFHARSFARAQILRGLTGLLLGQIAQELAENAPEAANPPPSPVLARFDALLDRHFTDHWGVADYAQALGLSPTHLSRLSRAATGRPASRLIEERLIREARRNLVYTNLPISTIAYALGFDDPAYFSRVFSRATGLSPRAFRDSR